MAKSARPVFIIGADARIWKYQNEAGYHHMRDRYQRYAYEKHGIPSITGAEYYQRFHLPDEDRWHICADGDPGAYDRCAGMILDAMQAAYVAKPHVRMVEAFADYFQVPSKRSGSLPVIAGSSSKGQTTCYLGTCLLYTSPSPRDQRGTRMPSSA